MRCVGFVLVLMALGTGPAGAEMLKAKFIGNEAFEITDGKVTLLTDFPYRSGAFGYMKYRFDEIRPTGKVLCLITHRHEDHFDPARFRKTGWTLLGPAGMVRGVDAARILPIQDLVRFEGLEIRPIRTPHGEELEHYSYWVRWHGLKLFFSGDTEEADVLTRIGKTADAVFVSPWLLEAWQAGSEQPGKVIVYHHKADEKVSCLRCIVPKQGDVIELGEGTP